MFVQCRYKGKQAFSISTFLAESLIHSRTKQRILKS